MLTTGSKTHFRPFRPMPPLETKNERPSIDVDSYAAIGFALLFRRNQ